MKITITTFFLICGMFVLSIPCYAYEYYAYRYGDTFAAFQWSDSLRGTSIHRTAWETAIDDWYDAASIVMIENSRSTNILDSEFLTDENWYGQTEYVSWAYDRSTGYYIATQFICTLNSAKTINATQARSTANHEIGHVFGLAHTNGTAIMNTNRNRTKIYTPQADDIEGVLSIYE